MTQRHSATRRKVLLLELNEINWTIIDRLIARGRLPNLARMRREGTVATPVASEVSPHLDPWVTWVTLHTGVERDVHGATVLEQGADTIRAKRTWHYVAEAGKSVGVFGSISAYPPTPVPGFVVPGPFAPGGETFPAYVAPVQELNQRYTRVHNKLAGDESVFDMFKRGVDLVKLGLSPATVARIAKQLVEERFKPHHYWKRISLQPLVNFDFFKHLYRRYRPDYATWHTNHCAHYMHHYWRAYDDTDFLVPASSEEKRKYGQAVEYGYGVADELVGRFMQLVDDDTVLVVASSMGQKPYVTERFRGGRIVSRFKDIHRILELAGAEGVTQVNAIMAPQWNLVIPDSDQRRRTAEALAKVTRAGTEDGAQMMAVEETGDTLTVTPLGFSTAPQGNVRFFFPGLPGERAEGYDFDELCQTDQPTPKQGMHDPRGVLLMRGGGVRAGVDIADVKNVDIAPTLLSFMGVPVPAAMQGRVLHEALGGKASSVTPLRSHASVA